VASGFDMTLADKRYVLAGPVVREPIPDLAQQWRSGAPDYSDRQGAQYWEWSDLSGGMGRRIIDCNNDEDRRRTWLEFGADTRFPGEVTLGPVYQTSGLVLPQPSLPQYGRFLDIPGAILFVSQAVSWKAAIWRNAGTTWNQVYGATQANANLGRSWRFPVPNDIEQDIYLGTGGGLFRSPIGGTSFAACLGSGSAAFPARGLGYDFGEETLLCQKTKDDGKLYTVTGHPTTPVATAIGYLGGLVGDMVTFYDQDGALVPYISVFKAPSGDSAGKPLASLYRVDLLEEKLYPVSDAPPAVNAPASGQTYRTVCVWNGWLYLALGDRLYRYQPGHWEPVPTGDESFHVTFNYSSTDFQPFTITAITPTARWLYLLCKSTTADKDAAVVAVGADGSWHAIHRITNPYGGDLGWSDDWSPERVYYLDSPFTMYFFDIPTIGGRPSTTPSYQYAQQGNFVLPLFDGRYGEITGTALSLTVLAEDLTATEYVDVQYGIDRSWPNTVLGRIEPGATTLYFASSATPSGTPFNTISFFFNLIRGASMTQSPKIRRIVFTYLKKPPVRYRYTAAIEVKATRTALRSIETLLAEFETVYNATTLQQLKYGRVSTYINLVAVNFIERPPATKTGQRNVYQIQLVMEEPI
jgi:hypothetical protein